MKTISPIVKKQKINDVVLSVLSVSLLYASIQAALGHFQPLVFLATLVVLPFCFVGYRVLVFLTIACFVFSASILRWSFPVVLTLRWGFLSLFVLRLFFDTAISSNLRIHLTGIHAFFILFLMAALVSTFYSVDFSTSLQRATSWFLVYLAVFIVFWRYLSSVERVYGMMDILLITVGMMAVLCVVFYLLPGQPVFYSFRFRGIAQNPNTLGNFMAMLLPLILWKREVVKDDAIYRSLFNFFIAFVLLLVLASGSVTCLGNAIFASAIFYFFMPKKGSFKKFICVVMLIFLFTIGMYYFFVPTELKELINLKVRGSFVQGSGRWEAWTAALQLFKNKPLLGYGFGTYDILFKQFSVNSSLTYGEISTHNSYLDLLMCNGLVGVIAFLPLFLSLLSLVLKQCDKKEDPDLMLLSIAISGSVLAYLCTTAVFESSFFSAGNIFTFPFWLLVMTLNKIKNTDLGNSPTGSSTCVG